MIVTKFTIYCEFLGCVWKFGYFGTTNITVDQAREEAARGGWSSKGGRDYCPYHTDKPKPAAAAGGAQ